MSAQPAAPDLVTEWTLVLDRLERDVLAVERVLAGDAPVSGGDFEPWRVPRTSGPLPVGLAERARHIAHRQVAVQAALVERMRSARQQAAVVRRLGTRSPGPAYVDTQA